VPSGRVHNLINIAVLAGLSAGALVLSRQGLLAPTPAQALYFTVGFVVGTFLLSPDLDLAEGHVDSKRRWGLLGFLWVPYGAVFSHRGLSHTWLLGPLTRLAYLALMVALLWGLALALLPASLHFGLPLLRLPPGLLSQPLLSHHLLGYKFLYPLLAGYYLSQWLHLIADGVRPDHGLRHSGRKWRGATRRLR
jgi:uncharacterized metal-binding protein